MGNVLTEADDDPKRPGSNNSAFFLHMKEPWRACFPEIVSLDLHRHPAREAEGAEPTCP